MEKIGVGLIGANPDRGWAIRAHLPALVSLPAYRLSAVSTTRLDTARRTAEIYGVASAYDNHLALIQDPDVNLVVVTVKTPNHGEMVRAALEARKAVLCEWPLGNGFAETVDLAATAARLGVRTAVGLQGRNGDAIKLADEMICDGYVGRVLSTSVVASGMPYGEFVEPNDAYFIDKKNGATLLTIPFGHCVDALCHVLGEFSSLSAHLATQRQTVRLCGTDTILPVTSPDQLAVLGTLKSGVVASLHLRGGRCRGTNFHWEINGTEGDIVITGPSANVQMSDLIVKAGRGDETGLTVVSSSDPTDTFRNLPVLARNVARAYHQFALDWQDGGSRCPSFGDAVARHCLLDMIEESARSGRRIEL